MRGHILSNNEVKYQRTRETCSIFVFILGVGITLTGCSKGVSSGGRVDASATIRVQSVTVREEIFPRRVEAVGSLLGLGGRTISSKVDGAVTQIAMEVGDVGTEDMISV